MFLTLDVFKRFYLRKWLNGKKLQVLLISKLRNICKNWQKRKRYSVCLHKKNEMFLPISTLPGFDRSILFLSGSSGEVDGT